MARQNLCFLVLAVVILPARLGAFEWSGRLDVLADGLQSPMAEERRQTLERLAAFPPHQTARYTLGALDDEALPVRLAAARLLGRGRVAAAVAPLTEWLTAQQEELRTAACHALGQIGQPTSLAPLAQTLNDSSASVRQAAVEALALIGSEAALSPLVGRLGDSHPRVRQAAAQGLGLVGARGAMIPLVARLQDPVQPVRLAVIGALARLGDVRAATALVQSLRDPSPEARAAALTALARSQPDRAAVPYVVALLDDREAHVRSGAVAALGALGGTRAAQALVDVLDDTTLVEPVVNALVAVGEPAVAPLCQILRRSGDHLARDSALRTLVRIGSPQATPTIVAALEEHRGNLPETALVTALGATAGPAGLLPLLERTTSDDDGLRIAALASLSAYIEPGQQDPRLTECLIDRVRRGSAGERLLALILLSRLGDSRALPDVLPLLQQGRRGRREGPVAELRRHFAFIGEELQETLQALEATNAAEPVAVLRLMRTAGAGSQRRLLLRLMQEERNAALRHEAALTLGEVADDEALRALSELLQEPPPVDRVAVLRALAIALRHSPSPEAIDGVNRLVTQAEPSLALVAADTLAKVGNRRAVEALGALLDRPEVGFRRKAVETLGDIGGDEAQAHLVSALEQDEDPLVRGLAAWALGKTGGDRVTDRLVNALADRGWSVRINAAGALARRADPRAAEAICQALLDEPRGAYRANLLLAAAATEAPCALAQAREVLRLPDRKTAVARAAAARVAAACREVEGAEQTMAGARAHALLRSCMAEDPLPWLRALCRQLAGPTEQDEGPADDWIEFYLYSEGSRRLRRHSRFLLILPQGLVKAGATDANGWAREAPVPSGDYEVQEVLVSEGQAP
jgi:HEAT repeat protein